MSMTHLTPAEARPEWCKPFLKIFTKCGVVSWAAEECGVARQTVYHYKKVHPDFAAEFEEAEAESIEWVEAAAVKGAVMAGNPQLIMFLLRSRKRHVYGEYKTVAGDPKAPITHDHNVSLSAKIEQLTEEIFKSRGSPDAGDSESDDLQ